MHESAFTPLSLQDQERILEQYRKWPEKPSDYTFVNLWCWREVYGLERAFVNNMVVLRQTRPHTRYWSPMGDPEDPAMRELLERAPIGTEFTRVPEFLARRWQELLPGIFSVEEAREHWDYLYLVQDLAHLAGRKFHKKKNLVNQFVKRFDFTYVDLDDAGVEQAMELQSDWCLWRDCEEHETLADENQAIINAFTDWNRLKGLMGGGLVVEGKMVAYTVAEALDDHTLVIHFEKACPSYPGAYQTINQRFLRKRGEMGEGFVKVNREQDLGEEGLRTAKLSYHPVDFVRKFRVKKVR